MHRRDVMSWKVRVGSGWMGQVLVLEHDGTKVLGLKLDILGETSCATTISYLDRYPLWSFDALCR